MSGEIEVIRRREVDEEVAIGGEGSLACGLVMVMTRRLVSGRVLMEVVLPLVLLPLVLVFGTFSTGPVSERNQRKNERSIGYESKRTLWLESFLFEKLYKLLSNIIWQFLEKR